MINSQSLTVFLLEIHVKIEGVNEEMFVRDYICDRIEKITITKERSYGNEIY